MTREKKRDEPTAPIPMDPGAKEALIGTPTTNRQRVCWAVQTLVAEVHDLFPETPVEYSDYDGRNTALAVTFDRTGLDNEDYSMFDALIGLVDADPRVAEVILDGDEEGAYVRMNANPRTQDNRLSFGLGSALGVLGGGDDTDDGDSL